MCRDKLHWIIAVVFACIVLAGCGGASGTVQDTPSNPPGATEGRSLPELSELVGKVPTQFIWDRCRGCDFLQEWPMENLAHSDSQTAIFTPDWNPVVTGPEGLAFGIYQMLEPEEAGATLFELDFARIGDLHDAWLGLGNPDTLTWDWMDLSGAEQFDCEYNPYLATTGLLVDFNAEQYFDEGILTLVLAFTGNESWQFSVMRPVVPIPVTRIDMETRPLAGLMGSELELDLDVYGTPPLTYAWEFADGLAPTVSTEQYPTITLGAAGAYQVSVTVDNEYGGPMTEYFTLTVTNGMEDWATLTGAADFTLVAEAITPDSNGGSLVTGYSGDSDGRNLMLLEQDSAGVVTRARHWPGSNTRVGADLIVAPSGGYYLLAETGMTASLGWSAHDGDVLIKLDADGNVEWSRQWSGADASHGYALVAAPWGAVYVVGSYVTDPASWNGQVLKVSDTGNLMWSRGYHQENANLHFNCGDINSMGSLVLGGEFNSGSPDTKLAAALVDPTGTVDWVRAVSKATGEECVALTSGPDNEVFISTKYHWRWYGGIVQLNSTGDYQVGINWPGSAVLINQMDISGDGHLLVCGSASSDISQGDHHLLFGMLDRALITGNLATWGVMEEGQSAMDFFIDAQGKLRLTGSSVTTIGLVQAAELTSSPVSGSSTPVTVTVEDLPTVLNEVSVEFVDLESGQRGIPRLLTMSLNLE